MSFVNITTSMADGGGSLGQTYSSYEEQYKAYYELVQKIANLEASIEADKAALEDLEMRLGQKEIWEDDRAAVIAGEGAGPGIPGLESALIEARDKTALCDSNKIEGNHRVYTNGNGALMILMGNPNVVPNTDGIFKDIVHDLAFISEEEFQSKYTEDPYTGKPITCTKDDYILRYIWGILTPDEPLHLCGHSEWVYIKSGDYDRTDTCSNHTWAYADICERVVANPNQTLYGYLEHLIDCYRNSVDPKYASKEEADTLKKQIQNYKNKIASAQRTLAQYNRLLLELGDNFVPMTDVKDYDPISGTDRSEMESNLARELMALEGIHGQNPETGAGIGSNTTYLKEYTNRIFGAPYQLLDSVDRRFESINSRLGSEYLRNFILNSPILYVRPGLPHYTGGGTGSEIKKTLVNMYIDTESGNMSHIESFLESLAGSTIFSIGSKLQRRMYGLKEAYNDYMQHVNYMCRSMAVYLNLTVDDKELEDIGLPNGIFIGNDEFARFESIKWENYRMLSSTKVLNNWEYLTTMVKSSFIAKSIGTLASAAWNMNPVSILIKSINEYDTGDYKPTAEEAINAVGTTIVDQWNKVCDSWSNDSMADVVMDKVTTVQFMVEPVAFTEQVSNRVKNSVLEDTVDGINNLVGDELSFILNSDTDTGILGNILGFLGDGVLSAAMSLNDLMKDGGGGFLHNFFSGAIQSIKGQKMIYPSIYESTETSMAYEYTMTLSVPYGDVYNYYTGICVPLAHILALAVPRMVTSNTITSPYLVQTYIPGMCTCNLGIVSSLTITKNPSKTHVSVHGYPLTVEVHFTISELYNSLSISPANDPASFLFNETLNDYLSNLAGLMPSVDTYTRQRKAMFKGLNEYFDPKNQEVLSDIVGTWIAKAENLINPFVGR